MHLIVTKKEELFISLLNSGVLTEKVDSNKLVKVFDKLKTKDVIQLKVDSSISKGKGLQPYVVKSKNKLKNGINLSEKKLNLAKLEIWDAESMLKIKIRKRDIKNIALNIFFISKVNQYYYFFCFTILTRIR